MQETRRAMVRQKTSLGLEWELIAVLKMPRQNEAKRKGEQVSQILTGARIQTGACAVPREGQG